MIDVKEEQQTMLEQIIEIGEQGRNTTSLESMQEQHGALMGWVDSFRSEIPETREFYARNTIYRNLPIEVEGQLARAFKSIGKGQFKPSADIAQVLFSQVYYRNNEKYGVIRP